MTRIEKKIQKMGLDTSKFFTFSVNKVEVYVENTEGEVMPQIIRLIIDFLHDKGLTWGGYKSGFGSWVLSKDYTHNDLVWHNID